MQTFKSSIALLIGIVPGIIYYLLDLVGLPGALFLIVVGGFIGFALSRPTVSKRRVIHGVAEYTPLLWPVAALVPKPDPEVPPAEPIVLDPVPQIAQEWLTNDVVLIARQFNVDARSELLPVLGDALLEAGCHNSDLLNFCFRRQQDDQTRRLFEELLRVAETRSIM